MSFEFSTPNSFMLDTSSLTLQPKVLRGGNLAFALLSPDKDEVIDSLDIAALTAAWNGTTAGDINGDGCTNQADLTILSSNIDYFEPSDLRYMLYSTPRQYQFFQQSRVWYGRPDAGEVSQMLPNTTPNSRDLWPTISPNGRQLAFVRESVTNNVRTTAIFIAPLTNGIAGAPLRVSPTNIPFAFAPSWSPDGTRLAFVCSWYDDGGNDETVGGFLANTGDPCVIDVTGRNFRQFAAFKTTIYPPTWLSNTELLYGGSAPFAGTFSMNTLCPNTLCYLDLNTSLTRVFDTDVLSGGTSGATLVADMPVVRNGVLFYRFYDSLAWVGASFIRWARLDGSNGWADPVAAFDSAETSFHNWVSLDETSGSAVTLIPISFAVSYFNVAWDNSLVYTQKFSTQFSTQNGESYFKSGVVEGNGVDSPLIFAQPYDNAVYDQPGNPDNPNHTPYNYLDGTDLDTGSWEYAYRNTAEWVR